jgi:hypothetical protein
MTSHAKYLRTQVVVNGVINLVVNGAIAYFMYRERAALGFIEIAFDIPITVAILAFLVSWIAIGSARKEIDGGRLARPDRIAGFPAWLPGGAALRALVLMVVFVAIYGGVVLVGPLYLLSPGGMSGGVYVLLKTLYTGACAGLAALVGILSVLAEPAPAGDGQPVQATETAQEERE